MMRSGHRRAGFTLIELLVVIAIIAVITSLLLAAVMKVRTVGPRAQTTSEIAAINNAINTVKGNASFGNVKYIPPGRWEAGAWKPFRLRNTYPVSAAPGEPDQYSFEAQYLQQMFGGGRGLNLADLGYGSALSADLDANQTLTFFLMGIPEVSGADAVFTGFSNNPQQPFIRRVQPDENRRSSGLDLGGSPRKYAVDATNGFPRMIDGWGRPFAYFAALDGRTNAYGPNGGFNDSAEMLKYVANAATEAPRPYKINADFVQPTGFQLVSAGLDGVFGTNGFNANNWASVPQVGQDDRANFSQSDLGAGPK